MPGPNDSGSKPAGTAPASGSNDLLSAADEPTAMWDEASLREAGFNQVAQMEPTESRTNPAPEAQQPGGPSIVIDNMPDASAAMRIQGTPVRASPVIVPAKKRSSGLSWPLTIGLAAALGTFVYLIVRFLK